jgi:hypothetical protein
MVHNRAKLFAACLLTLGALVMNGIWPCRPVAAQLTPRHCSAPVQAEAGGPKRPSDADKPALAVSAPLPAEDTFEFEFKDLPWAKVLERYSNISRLAFTGNYIPSGTATFIPPSKGKRQYTVREITDIINEMLLIRPTAKSAVEPKADKATEKAAQLKKRLELVVPQYKSTYGVTLKDHLDYIRDRYSGDRGDDVNVTLLFTIDDKVFTDAEQEAIRGTKFTKSEWELTEVTLQAILEKLAGRVRTDNSDIVFALRGDRIELTPSPESSYLLVRLDKTFTVLRAGQKIDSALVPRVDLADLATRGKTELVSTVIPLKKLKATDIALDVQKQVSPFGEIVILEKSNQLILRDTAGKLSQIHATLTELENREAEIKRDKAK